MTVRWSARRAKNIHIEGSDFIPAVLVRAANLQKESSFFSVPPLEIRHIILSEAL